MKKISTLPTIVLMCFIFMLIPVSILAVEDPFLDAGFIQARKQVSALPFTLEDLEGKQVSISDFRGKTVLLFFWTTW